MALTVRRLQNFIGGEWIEPTGTEVRRAEPVPPDITNPRSKEES